MYVSMQDLSAERGRLQAQAEKQVHEVEQRFGDEMKRKVTYQLYIFLLVWRLCRSYGNPCAEGYDSIELFSYASLLYNNLLRNSK